MKSKSSEQIVAASIAAADAPGRVMSVASSSPVWLRLFLGYLGLLCAAFALPLIGLTRYALHSELNSHVVLVPFVSAYLLWIRWKDLPPAKRPSWSGASAFAVTGFAMAATAWKLEAIGGAISRNDHLTLTTLGFVSFVVAGGFAFAGAKWMRATAFSFAFLLFMVPLPDYVVELLENASKLASAEAASWFFNLSGTSFLRTNNVFELPGITIQVAQECSGIRSSWVLIMTSLLAAHLFLRTTWRRALLVALVIPLGVLRNGFRILVIGLLCVNYGPQMINSVIHRRGGPFFFVLSLVPLFLFLWWLRRSEVRRAAESTPRGERPAPVRP